MSVLEPLLDRARAAKTRLKLWNAELDRLRYPAYYRGRLSPAEANLLLSLIHISEPTRPY